MADFVNRMNWKYVMVLNSPDEANRKSRDLFTERLKDFGICVVASYEFVTDGTDTVIIEGMNKADTVVVAVFAEPDRYIENFLAQKNALLQGLNSKRMIFVANRRWGSYADQYINGITGSWLQDSVFFELPNPTIPEFLDYLNRRDVVSGDGNPWLSEIYEEVMSCNLPGSFTQGRQNCISINNR